MSSAIEKKLREFPSAYVNQADMHQLIPQSDDARYAQVKRALERGYLIRLKKGVYLLGNYLKKKPPHPFEMAYHLQWPSYISLESALSYHGLIPEAVYSTTSVTTKRSCEFKNQFGIFSYRHLPVKEFYLGVTREVDNENIFFIATPWKAITDYIFCYKKDYKDFTSFLESLRIDVSSLPPLEAKFATKLEQYYQSKRIHKFIKDASRYFHHEY